MIRIILALLLVNPIFVIGCGTTNSSKSNNIASHKWWSKKPSTKVTNAIVNLVIDTNSGNCIYVDDVGKTSVRKFYFTSNGKTPLPTSEVGARRFTIFIEGDKRYTKDIAVDKILSALDEAEFRDGPGNK